MLFHYFDFLPDELLFGRPVPVQREHAHGAEEREHLHGFSLLDLLQRFVFGVVIFDVPDHGDAEHVAHERPTERGPVLVSFDLHKLEVALVIQLVKGYLGLVFVLLFEFVQLLAPLALVLQVRVVALVLAIRGSDPDVPGLLQHALPDLFSVKLLLFLVFWILRHD